MSCRLFYRREPEKPKMKKIILFCFLISNFTLINAQEIKSETLDSLYVKSLNNRYDLLLSSGYKYIEPNNETERIKSKFDLSVYKFENQEKLFKIAYKNNKELNLYRINHKIVSKDTIDINIGEIFMTVRKGIYFKNKLHFKKTFISIPCGGTNGYQPDFRYVFSQKDNKWIVISEYFSIN
jgi:hypothetical protein